MEACSNFPNQLARFSDFISAAPKTCRHKALFDAPAAFQLSLDEDEEGFNQKMAGWTTLLLPDERNQPTVILRRRARTSGIPLIVPIFSVMDYLPQDFSFTSKSTTSLLPGNAN